MLEPAQACQMTDGELVNDRILSNMAKRKNPAAVALGRLGGKAGGPKGGRARAAKLTPERRREIARKAARARWANERKAT